MRVQIIALGLITTSIGFTYESDDYVHRNSYDHSEDSCDCNSCNCDSCDCYSFCDCCSCCESPTPDASIDCTCFVPQWYNMSCDCGLFISVDFLYFYGRETNLAYAAKSQTTSFGTTELTNQTLLFSPTSLQHLNATWDPGVRIGLGWNTNCDGWDLAFYWTYYYNSSKQKKTVDNPSLLIPSNQNFAYITQWGDPALNSGNIVFNSIKGEWKFRYNNFDLVTGKRYWLSKCFTMRPFAGLRGLLTETHFISSGSRSNYMPSSTDTNVLTYSEIAKFKNTSWGVGFVVGIEPTWFFTPCFSFFAGADIALVWGNHRVKKSEQILFSDINASVTNASVDSRASSSSSYYYMTPGLDLGLGLRYENYYCENQYHLQVDLGWEDHVLFHLNDRYQLTNTLSTTSLGTNLQAIGIAQFTETHHDVSFGGLVVRVRFDF